MGRAVDQLCTPTDPPHSWLIPGARCKLGAVQNHNQGSAGYAVTQLARTATEGSEAAWNALDELYF